MDNIEKHKYYLEQCHEMAIENANVGIFPFGALILNKENKVIAKGRNGVFTLKDPTCHAEIDAIRKACALLARYDLSDCVMYSSTKPCPMCEGAIFWSNLQTVYYANSSEDCEEQEIYDKLYWEQILLEENNKKMKFIQIHNAKNTQYFNDFFHTFQFHYTLFMQNDKFEFPAVTFHADQDRKEQVHGHFVASIQVQSLKLQRDTHFVIKQNIILKQMSHICEQLHKYMLIPKNNKFITIERQLEQFKISFKCDNSYIEISQKDCLIFDCENVTNEFLANYILQKFLNLAEDDLKLSSRVTIEVENGKSKGQASQEIQVLTPLLQMFYQQTSSFQIQFACSRILAFQGLRENIQSQDLKLCGWIHPSGAQQDLILDKLNEICKSMDQKLLLAQMSDYLEIVEENNNYFIKSTQDKVQFRFPKEDCLVLKCRNTSWEDLVACMYLKLINSLTEQQKNNLFRSVKQLSLGLYNKQNQGCVVTYNLYKQVYDYDNYQNLELFDKHLLQEEIQLERAHTIQQLYSDKIKDKVILNLGSATGYFSRLFAKWGAKLVYSAAQFDTQVNYQENMSKTSKNGEVIKNIKYNPCKPSKLEEQVDYCFVIMLFNQASFFEMIVQMCKSINLNIKDNGEICIIMLTKENIDSMNNFDNIEYLSNKDLVPYLIQKNKLIDTKEFKEEFFIYPIEQVRKALLHIGFKHFEVVQCGKHRDQELSLIKSRRIL